MKPTMTKKPQDVDIMSESALAIAQSTIQNAMNAAGIKPAELARRMGRYKSHVHRMMQGDYNMTIKTLARAVAACGFRLEIGYGPDTAVWAEDQPRGSTMGKVKVGELMRMRGSKVK